MDSGACPAGANRQSINAAAAKVYQWKQIIHPDYRQQMLDSKIPNGAPFFCPGRYCNYE